MINKILEAEVRLCTSTRDNQVSYTYYAMYFSIILLTAMHKQASELAKAQNK